MSSADDSECKRDAAFTQPSTSRLARPETISDHASEFMPPNVEIGGAERREGSPKLALGHPG